MEKAFLQQPSSIAASLNVDLSRGLTATQAQLAREKYGDNTLPEDPPVPLWRLVLDQFQDQLTLILLVSALVSFLLAIFEGEPGWSSFVDPIVILSILILNAIVGVKQEKSAEEAIAALGEYSIIDAKVLRNNQLIKIKQADLVPGDVVDLSVGDSVPADCRLFDIKSHSFMVDQSVLTGESESVSKDIAPISDSRAVLQDQTNMVFSGTNITVGHALAIVTLTGNKTAIGNIHKSIVSQISEPTPLKQKLDEFGETLAKVITVICVLVWLINIRNFGDPSHHGWFNGAIYYFKIAIALAVAAIPEGLAVVITTCLALGTKKMAKNNAIVRNLPSVETLGSTNVICSDKTGTLTTNQMCVSDIIYLNDNSEPVELSVSGTDYSTTGRISQKHSDVPIQSPAASIAILEYIARISSLCNDSKLTKENGSIKYIGEPTEAALRVLAEKLETPLGTSAASSALGFSSGAFHANDYYETIHRRFAVFEFTRDRKCMSVVTISSASGGSSTLLVKGAPEAILSQASSYLCQGNEPASVTTKTLDQNTKNLLIQQAQALGNQGLRVIALAVKEKIEESDLKENLKEGTKRLNIETGTTFVGFAAMRDPPRAEVKSSIARLKKAGLRIIMVTGDSPATATSIGQQIGLLDADESSENLVYTGRQLEAMTDKEKLNACRKAKIFSRVEPVHKSLLVDCLQRLGNVVAVTGDGVNDAPALKKADIGIAMGSGTDVAKFAADMVLADDNFSTIESAVREGRAIYYNTKQFIRYLISSNIGEVVSIFLTVLLGLPEALIPVQLLWVNLVTDGLPATALGFNPPDNEIMSRPPRSKDEPLIDKWLFFRYMVVGTYVGCATVFGYIWWFVFYSEGPQISFSHLSHFHHCAVDFPEIGCGMFTGSEAAHGSTVSLSILVVIEMFNALNSLSEADSLLVFPVWRNMYLVYAVILSLVLHLVILYVPWLQALFSTVPLNGKEWTAVIAISFPVILIDELFKVVDRNRIAKAAVHEDISLERKTK